MRMRAREHQRIVTAGRNLHEGARLHTHGVWTRRVHVGGQEHAKPEYLHIFATDDPDRFLVHLADGDHFSCETKESVDDMLEDFAAAT